MATHPKITHDKYFLQRVWYHAAPTRSQLGIKSSWHPNDDFQSVNRSNIAIGIVVGITNRRYSVVPEWKKMGSAHQKQDCEPQWVAANKIFVGIDVDFEELLTHDHEFVRKAIRDRIEVKGLPS